MTVALRRKGTPTCPKLLWGHVLPGGWEHGSVWGINTHQHSSTLVSIVRPADKESEARGWIFLPQAVGAWDPGGQTSSRATPTRAPVIPKVRTCCTRTSAQPRKPAVLSRIRCSLQRVLVHSRMIRSGQKVGETPVSINGSVGKQNGVCPHNGIFFSLEKEGNFAISRSVDEPRRHHAG